MENKIYCKEIPYAANLCIKASKPSIKSVNKSNLKIRMLSCKIIKTCLGNRLLIKGYKLTEVNYKPNDSKERNTFITFKQPFLEIVPLNKDGDVKIRNVVPKVELCEIEKANERCFQVFALISIQVEVEEETQEQVFDKHEYDNENDIEEEE
ncbi:hypothetical protein [Clostridium ihumii]|uniref:hypothetical protein n=1 Tax=Clostridium ihumii TaxID=1470356 RepID=UPI000590B123|nr:hypothetical protein [Clostridium ihumii]